VATPHGFLQAAGGDIMQVQMLIYRLQADPDLIDRYYRESSLASGVDLFRAGAKLKILRHAPECLGYTQTYALLQPSANEEATQEVQGLLSYVMTLDLAAIRRRHAELVQQVIGETCHAHRGLSAV
jgi:hypothetical protein